MGKPPERKIDMIAQTRKSMSVRALVVTAMLAAVSFILMFFNFSVPFMPSFVKLDISDLPALIGSFSLGPVYGVLICLIKNLLNLMRTSTGGVGELSNFLLSAMFVFPAGLIYQKMKSRKGAIIGSLVGAVCMAVGSVFTNIFLVYPIYYNFMPKEVILQAYQAIVPSMTSVEQSIICFNMPFTFLKAMLSVIVALLTYKRLSPILKGSK
jgi:riboflavin transporter FmnP